MKHIAFFSKKHSGATSKEKIPSHSQLKLSKFQYIKALKKVIVKVICDFQVSYNSHEIVVVY